MDAEESLLLDQFQYAKHRGKSKQYINKLVKAGVLVMRGGKIDVRASDQVLDDKPLPEIEEPLSARAISSARTPEESLGGAPQRTTYAEARTIRTVFQAKLARLEFETKQGKLIASPVHQRQNRQRRVSLQPVVHEQKQELLVLPCPPNQHAHRFARFRIGVLYLRVRRKHSTASSYTRPRRNSARLTRKSAVAESGIAI